MNAYLELKHRQQIEYDAFPKFFAFTDDSFTMGLASLGLAPEDSEKVKSIGYGGFIRRSDWDNYRAMCDRHHTELQAAIAADESGCGFIYAMFRTELINHEYAYTGDVSEALEACRVTKNDLALNPALQKGLQQAKKSLGG